MALKTLHGIALGDFIAVNHATNEITFKIQDGPIETSGLNGCQVDEMIATARLIVIGLNRRFPCDDNDDVITHLSRALISSKRRKEDREARGVEGHDKA